MSAEQKDTRTATQRLDDLERVVASLYQGLQQLANGLDSVAKQSENTPLLQQGVRLMSRRLEAAIAVLAAKLPEAGIEAATEAKMVEFNVNELKEQVNAWLGSGALTASETVTADKCFVVTTEYKKDGTVADARLQFSVETQKPDVVAALTGKKAGDLVVFGEDRYDLKINEVYAINEPKPALASVPAETSAETSAENTAPPAQAEDTATETPAATSAETAPAATA